MFVGFVIESFTMSGKYRLTTLGCKVNQYESEQVRQLLEAAGMRPAQPGEHADWAIVNTCAVTCGATAKSRKALRKLAKDGTTRTVAIGCYASAESDRVAAIQGVTHVLGHEVDALSRIRDLLADAQRSSVHASPVDRPGNQASTYVQVGLRLADNPSATRPGLAPTPHPNLTTTYYSIPTVHPIVNSDEPVALPLREFANRTRAFLKVQDGCDAHCTYCIIPKLRTRLVDKPVDLALDEARRLVAAGHREIVLTGIFLGAYGRGTAIRKRFNRAMSPLAALVDALARVDGLSRLRLSSLEPGDLDDALLEVVAKHDNCVPHFHLPLQSGSADILRRMNRQYTVDDFIDMIDRVNAALDRPAVTTDVIVGFPGETEDSFAETLQVARYSGFCKIHAFPFSPRPKTAAARWKDRYVHNAVVTQRLARLRTLERELALEFKSRFIGEMTRVLIEGPDSPPFSRGAGPDANCLAHGRSDRYFEIHVDQAAARPGDLLRVRVDRVTPKRVHGTRM
jgi:threonylcarbamoyladenosine tRNA methylthiotransferase MtaB